MIEERMQGKMSFEGTIEGLRAFVNGDEESSNWDSD
jgi:hypothetical protein